MTLKQTLPLLLKQKKWSYQKLSEESGVPKSTLHSWVSTGQSAISLEQLKAVADSLQVGIHTLVWGLPDPHENSTEVLEQIFSGDIRVTLHRIKK